MSKTYVGKGKKLGSGWGIKIGLKVEDLKPNERGYVNLVVAELKDGPDKYGNTHTVYVDDWKPGQSKGGESRGAF